MEYRKITVKTKFIPVPIDVYDELAGEKHSALKLFVAIWKMWLKEKDEVKRGWFYRSNKDLAKDSGLDEKTVRSCLEILKRKGFINVVEVKDAYKTHQAYWYQPSTDFWEEVEEKTDEKTTEAGGKIPAHGAGGKIPAHDKSLLIKREINTRDQRTSGPEDTGPGEDFSIKSSSTSDDEELTPLQDFVRNRLDPYVASLTRFEDNETLFRGLKPIWDEVAKDSYHRAEYEDAFLEMLYDVKDKCEFTDKWLSDMAKRLGFELSVLSECV